MFWGNPHPEGTRGNIVHFIVEVRLDEEKRLSSWRFSYLEFQGALPSFGETAKNIPKPNAGGCQTSVAFQMDGNSQPADLGLPDDAELLVNMDLRTANRGAAASFLIAPYRPHPAM